MRNEIGSELNSANNCADNERKPDERKFLVVQNTEPFKGRIYSLLVCFRSANIVYCKTIHHL